MKIEGLKYFSRQVFGEKNIYDILPSLSIILFSFYIDNIVSVCIGTSLSNLTTYRPSQTFVCTVTLHMTSSMT